MKHTFKNIYSLLLVLALSACGGGGHSAGQTGVGGDQGTGVIGPSGGTVSADNNAAAVTFPANAFSSGTTVTVATSQTAPPSNRLVTGTAYDFGPSGQFAAPAVLTLKYSPANIPAGALESRLVIYTASAGTWQAVPGSTVDLVAHTVSATVDHFSTYAILADNQFAGSYSGSFSGTQSTGGTWAATVDAAGNLSGTATGGFVGTGSVSFNGTSTIPLAGSGTSQGFTVTFAGTFVLQPDGRNVTATGTWGSTNGTAGTWTGAKN